MKTAIAIGAHPDDIEFMMAGTLLLLKKHGYQIHYLNVSSGNVGSTEHSSEATAAIRLKEAENAAEILDAQFHPPFCNDIEIFYTEKNIRHLASIFRVVKPKIILTHSPVDYMEDHTNTCRLVVSAAFVREMKNFKTTPPIDADLYDCTIYHSLPHTLRDPLRRKIYAGSYVNTSSVLEIKSEALKAHESQQSWLNISQNLNSYLQAMDEISFEVGKMSKKFIHAEGWRRHLHYGLCAPDTDPLKDLGQLYFIDEEFEKNLDKGI